MGGLAAGGIAIVGPGRVGLSLARALARSGTSPVVLGPRAVDLPDSLGHTETDWREPLATSELVMIAVPDDHIAEVANKVAGLGVIGARAVILHTSGLHDRGVLAPLAAAGAATGSWHPVQTFARRDGEPDVLAGSPAVVEGDAAAMARGRELAQTLRMFPVIEIQSAEKVRYHAAAVFASNYVVVVATVAARLAREAGLGDRAEGAEVFVPLMRRTIENFAADPGSALTGPVARGDAATVRRHLAALDGEERELYVLLGREALRIARHSGLDESAATAVEVALGGGGSGR
ncbi:MAG: Rossmann-like and DUF2520 domain-containing protein [Gemmatimonadales bacterium]